MAGAAAVQDALLLHDGTLWGKNEHVKRGGWRNIIAEPLMRGAGMHYLAAWNEAIPLHDMHTPGECSHFCSPGGYNIWVWQLWQPTSPATARKRSVWSVSRTSLTRVQARLSAAGPRKSGRHCATSHEA